MVLTFSPAAPLRLVEAGSFDRRVFAGIVPRELPLLVCVENSVEMCKENRRALSEVSSSMAPSLLRGDSVLSSKSPLSSF